MVILNNTKQDLRVGEIMIPAEGHVEQTAEQVRPYLAVLHRWADADTTTLDATGSPVKRITVTGGHLPKLRA